MGGATVTLWALRYKFFLSVCTIASGLLRTWRPFTGNDRTNQHFINAEAFELQFSDIVERSINPAVEALVAYLEGEYRELAPERVGVKQYPGGEDYYRYLTRLHTTMDVTPEEVQQIGFEMVQDMLHRRCRGFNRAIKD